MKGYVKAYNSLSRIVKIILAIIPVTGWINAVLYRLAKNRIIAGIVAIPLGPIFWVVDLITVILSNKPTVFA